MPQRLKPADDSVRRKAGDAAPRRRLQAKNRRRRSPPFNSEKQYQMLVEDLNEGVCALDHAQLVTFANPRMAKILGYDRPDELLGRSLFEFIPEDLHSVAREHMARRMRGEREQYECQMLRRDGRRIFVDIAATPLRNDTGEVVGSVGAITDVTERRQSEIALRSSEQRFANTLESAPIGMALVTPEGRFSLVNQALCKITGYDKAELEQLTFQQITHPDDLDADLNYVRRLLAAEISSYQMHKRYLRKDGSVVWILLSVSLLRDEGDRPLHFIAQIQDITENRRNAQLLEESTRLREAIFEASPFSIISTTTDGVILSFNATAERMLGYQREELVGRCTPEIIHDADEVVQRAQQLSQEFARPIDPGFDVFVYKARLGITQELEWTYIRKDGTRFPVNLAVTALRDASGQITGYLGIAYDITERKRREAHTQHIAQHDALTGLPNRILFHDRTDAAIERARTSGRSTAVMMVDLDHFKRINDSLGHDVGDELLRIVSRRIQSCVRYGDTVARMGGDEFVVLLPELPDADTATQIADQIVRAVCTPISIMDHDLVVSTSIGIALYPEHGLDRHTLMKNADTAMYRAKNAGRSGYMLFSRDMAEGAARQLAIEAAIRAGLRNSEFRLHYQPQICLNSGQIVGLEALIRWQRNGEMIPPTTFIPVAEQAGLMLTLGEWVLRTALRETQILSEHTGTPVRLAVNLSPQQIQNPYFKEKLLRLLQETGFDPQRLEIEITEGLLISDLEQVHDTLSQIRRLGVSVALDDFGTGYSSLSYLARFPINTLKIDRSFMLKLMENTSDRAVVQAILAMAQSLKLRVIAEGVETPQQLAFLRTQENVLLPADAGRDIHDYEKVCVQGYHFCKALDLESLIRRFEEIRQLSKGRVEQTPALPSSEDQCVLFN